MTDDQNYRIQMHEAVDRLGLLAQTPHAFSLERAAAVAAAVELQRNEEGIQQPQAEIIHQYDPRYDSPGYNLDDLD